MNPTIRLSSAGPRFRSGGFDLTPSWSSFDVGRLTPEQIATLRERTGDHGRWIRIHPDDREVLKALLAGKATAKPSDTKNSNTNKTGEAGSKEK